MAFYNQFSLRHKRRNELLGILFDPLSSILREELKAATHHLVADR